MGKCMLTLSYNPKLTFPDAEKDFSCVSRKLLASGGRKGCFELSDIEFSCVRNAKTHPGCISAYTYIYIYVYICNRWVREPQC